MKYLCLVYLYEQRLHELPDKDCVDYDQELRSSGHCIASEALWALALPTQRRHKSHRPAKSTA